MLNPKPMQATVMDMLRSEPYRPFCLEKAIAVTSILVEDIARHSGVPAEKTSVNVGIYLFERWTMCRHQIWGIGGNIKSVDSSPLIEEINGLLENDSFHSIQDTWNHYFVQKKGKISLRNKPGTLSLCNLEVSVAEDVAKTIGTMSTEELFEDYLQHAAPEATGHGVGIRPVRLFRILLGGGMSPHQAISFISSYSSNERGDEDLVWIPFSNGQINAVSVSEFQEFINDNKKVLANPEGVHRGNQLPPVNQRINYDPQHHFTLIPVNMWLYEVRTSVKFPTGKEVLFHLRLEKGRWVLSDWGELCHFAFCTVIFTKIPETIAWRVFYFVDMYYSMLKCTSIVPDCLSINL